MAKKTSKGSGRPIPKVKISLDLLPEEREGLISTLKVRFDKHPSRHGGLEWSKIIAKLDTHPEKLPSLNAMESTGGEPDVIAHDKTTDEYLFIDCSAESPVGRRNICYDREAEKEREKKGIHPAGNAIDIAAAMGIELLNEIQYRELQKLGEFDTKTSSWIQTPVDIRNRGGALFAERRYQHVFVYHNGAPSFFGVRGFRGLLRL